jgi:hypothetical protein
MAMRLLFVCVTVAGSTYLLLFNRGDRRFAIAALVASTIGLLLQLNLVTLHVHYARTIVWAAIAVCAALLWVRDASKSGATVAASMLFASVLPIALALRLLH